jgi:hypothetical protein
MDVRDPESARYIQQVSALSTAEDVYTIVRLGVVHGQDVLMQQRAIFMPGFVCLVR